MYVNEYKVDKSSGDNISGTVSYSRRVWKWRREKR